MLPPRYDQSVQAEKAETGIPVISRGRGLPLGDVTFLCGDKGTYKSRLGRAFLSGCFAPGNLNGIGVLITLQQETDDTLAERLLLHLQRHVKAPSLEQLKQLRDACETVAPWITQVTARSERPAHPNAAFLRRGFQQVRRLCHGIPTLSAIEHVKQLKDRLSQCGPQAGTNDASVQTNWQRMMTCLGTVLRAANGLHRHKAAICQRIVCRPLEVHDLTASVVTHILRHSIRRAKQLLHDYELYEVSGHDVKPTLQDVNQRFSFARIRLVLDDWTRLTTTFPDAVSDPLFLPFLLKLLRAEGVTSLVIGAASGGDGAESFSSEERAVGTEMTHHINTWPVAFYGQRRVAIATRPPMGDRSPSVVREIRPTGVLDGETVFVDPHFEIYSGLEHNEPRPVPLQVRLYAKTDRFRAYIKEMDSLCRSLFMPSGGVAVVVGDESLDYESLRNTAYLQGDTRLDHTLVLQVDEFWMQSGTRRELQALTEYLREMVGNPISDPFRLFGPHADDDDTAANRAQPRFDTFRTNGYTFKKFIDEQRERAFDRVPYMWDFGFLLLRKRHWTACERQDDKGIRIVIELIDKVTAAIDDKSAPAIDDNAAVSQLSWRDFLAAAKLVAESAMRRGDGVIRAFDLDLRATEAFSCWVLEVWFSEILEACSNGPTPIVLERVMSRNPRNDNERSKREGHGLLALLDEPKVKALYRTWLLIGEVLVRENLESEESFELLSRPADADAVAARHWYSTAAAVPRWESSDPRVPIPMPGRFTVRGDWFLAVAGGSRSARLGCHAIDVLSSRRANIRRFQLGLGLPTRKIMEDGEEDKFRGALTTVNQSGERVQMRLLLVTAWKLMLGISGYAG